MMETVKRMFMHHYLRKWMIFHTGHNAYFRKHASGYTKRIASAGWYTETETAAWESHSRELVRRY